MSPPSRAHRRQRPLSPSHLSRASKSRKAAAGAAAAAAAAMASKFGTTTPLPLQASQSRGGLAVGGREDCKSYRGGGSGSSVNLETIAPEETSSVASSPRTCSSEGGEAGGAGNLSMTAVEEITTGGGDHAVDRQTHRGAIENGDDDLGVGDLKQETARWVDKRGEAEAAVAVAATSDGVSGTGYSHREGFTTNEDSVPTSSSIFELEEEAGEGGDIIPHSRNRLSRRARSGGSVGNSGSGSSSSGGGRGGGGTIAAPCFVTHGEGVQGEGTTASATAAGGVRGVEKGDGVDGNLYDGGDSSSGGSTLILGRPEPSSVHWKYSRRLLQT